MKKQIILPIILFLILSATFMAFIISDNSPNARKKTESTELISIPKLLDRYAAIQNGKEWENVQNYYSKAKADLASDNNNADAKLVLAKVFIQEARVTGEHGHYYPAAMSVLDHLIEQSGTTKDQKFQALTAKAAVMLSQHEFQKALDIAKKSIVLNPYNSQVYGAMVDASIELGDYDAAVKYADQMASIRPDLRSYSRVSYVREVLGDIEGAIEAMKMAIQAGAPGSEHSAWCRVTLGKLYEDKLEDLDYAEAVYKRALLERPQYPFAAAGIASVELKRGNFDTAERLLKGAITAIPEVGFYMDLVKIYHKTNRDAEAASLIREIFLMLEDDVKNGHNMNMEYANFYMDILHDPGSALVYAEKEYLKRPNNKDVQALMARIKK